MSWFTTLIGLTPRDNQRERDLITHHIHTHSHPYKPFTIQYFTSLCNTLQKHYYTGTITHDNQLHNVIELIRSISEHLIYDDQHTTPTPAHTHTSPSASPMNSQSEAPMNVHMSDDITVNQMFELFASKEMLSLFIKILTHRDIATTIKIQVIQSLSILIQNIQHHTSLYYILSNNYINLLITTVPRHLRELKQNKQQHRYRHTIVHNASTHHATEHNTDELIAFYVSLLKTLSLRLNPQALQFFFQPHSTPPTFPLLTEALPYHNHDEQMICNASRTLTLHVLQLAKQQREQQNIQILYDYLMHYVLRDYFHEVVKSLNHMIEKLYHKLSESYTRSNNTDIHGIEDLLDKLVDTYYYIQDIIDVQLDEVNVLLCDTLFTEHARKLINDTNNGALEMRHASLYIMSQLLSTVTYNRFVDQCNQFLLLPADTRSPIQQLILSDNTLIVHNALLLIRQILQNPATDAKQLQDSCLLPKAYGLRQSEKTSELVDVMMLSNSNMLQVTIQPTSIDITHNEDAHQPTFAPQLLQLLLEKNNIPTPTVQVICTLLVQLLDGSDIDESRLTLLNHVYSASVKRVFASCENRNINELFILLQHEYRRFEKNEIQVNNKRPTASTLLLSIFSKKSSHPDVSKYSSIRIHTSFQYFFQIRATMLRLNKQTDSLFPTLFHKDPLSDADPELNAVIDVEQHQHLHAVTCTHLTNSKNVGEIFLSISKHNLLLLSRDPSNANKLAVRMNLDLQHILYSFAEDNMLLLMIQHPTQPHASALRAAKQEIQMESSSTHENHNKSNDGNSSATDNGNDKAAVKIDIPIWQLRLKIIFPHDTVNTALSIMRSSSQRKHQFYSAVYDELKPHIPNNVAASIEDSLKNLVEGESNMTNRLPLLSSLLLPNKHSNTDTDPQFVPQLF